MAGDACGAEHGPGLEETPGNPGPQGAQLHIDSVGEKATSLGLQGTKTQN